MLNIDGLPPTANAPARTKVGSVTRSWQAAYNSKKQWEKKVWAEIRGSRYAGEDSLPSRPLKKASLTLTRISSSEPDFDGLVHSFKGIIDALVSAGILENDRPSNIGSPIYLWEKGPRGQGSIRIEVTERD